MSTPRQRAVFTNEKFYYSLLLYIAQFLCHNVYDAIVKQNLYNIIPIIFQIVLITMIIDRGRYTRPMIKIYCWLIIIGNGCLTISTLYNYDSSFNYLYYIALIRIVAELIFGALILDFANRTIILKRPEYLEEEVAKATEVAN